MKKILHTSVIIIMVVAIFFTGIMFVLRYHEKGETNMPFDISKISIISTIDGQDVEDKKNTWNKVVEQNNDIYIYIEKNENYSKTEAIKNIIINNFRIAKNPKIGDISFYKPSTNENTIFENLEEYKTEEITFSGDQQTEIQKLQISNQGGIVAFRCANQNLGNYTSNDKELNYKKLLKGINATYEDINAEIYFDIDIVLENELKFKATVQLNIPAKDVIEKGTASEELTVLNIVFKRVEN